MTIKGEVAFTTGLVFARDGKYLLAGEVGPAGQHPGMVAVYDAASGMLKRNITDFRKPVNSLAFNVDGSILGTGGHDGLVRLWQYPAIALNASQPDYWSQQDVDGATVVAFSPDNRTLARLGDDGIKLYNLVLPGDAVPGRLACACAMAPLPKPNGYTCAVFGKDSKTLYTGSVDGMIKLWDTESGQLTGAFKGHSGAISAGLSIPLSTSLPPPAATIRSASGPLTSCCTRAISPDTRAPSGPRLSARAASASCRPAPTGPYVYGMSPRAKRCTRSRATPPP